MLFCISGGKLLSCNRFNWPAPGVGCLVAGMAIREDFIMDLTYALATVLLGQMIKTNRTWNTRDTEQPLDVAATSMTNEMRRKEKEEQMAKMMTQVELLVKHMLGTGTKSVNVIGSHNVI
ncbi:hypothetical protein RDI58_020145 [Solanum bulbocastanum]|uniref:Uncharacterized protein n=1 Tax=Solanum bulbocastanum TaxID=147425 RepID=A0AAN8Y7K9_SOLBU